MTPAEHYIEMERWLKAANDIDDTGFVMVDNRAYHVVTCLQRAQVHATAATVNPDRLWPKRYVLGYFRCPYCDQVVYSVERDLTKHIAAAHPGTPYPPEEP